MVDVITQKNYEAVIEGFKRAFDDGLLTFAVVDTGGLRHVGYAQDFYSKAFPRREEPARIYLRQKDTFIQELKNKETGKWERKEIMTSEGFEETPELIHPIYRPLMKGICNPHEEDRPIKERSMLEPASYDNLPRNKYILAIDDSIISGQSMIGTVIHLLGYKDQLGFEELYIYVNRDEQGRMANFVREGRGNKNITLLDMLKKRAPIEYEEFEKEGLLGYISTYMPDVSFSEKTSPSYSRRELVKHFAWIVAILGLDLLGNKKDR